MESVVLNFEDDGSVTWEEVETIPEPPNPEPPEPPNPEPEPEPEPPDTLYTRVVLWGDSPSIIAMTSSQFQTLAEQGVTDLVAIIGGGQWGPTGYLYTFGGTIQFSPNPNITDNPFQMALGMAGEPNSVSTRAENAGINLYLGCYLQNYHAGSDSAPGAGDWNNDDSWNTFNEQVTLLAEAIAWSGCAGIAFDTEGDGRVNWQFTDPSIPSIAQARGEGISLALGTGFDPGYPGTTDDPGIPDTACPILIYQTMISGAAQVPNSYYGQWQPWYNETQHTDTWQSPGSSAFSPFLRGLASPGDTTNPPDIYSASAIYYDDINVTAYGPYGTQGSNEPNPWPIAVAFDLSAQAAFPPNVHLCPFVWPTDNNQSHQWTQKRWNTAWATLHTLDMYFIYQYSPLLTGVALTIDFSNYNGVDYTPL